MDWEKPPIKIDTSPIPSRKAVRDINLGVMATSEYANARAAAWLTIRRYYDQEMASRMRRLPGDAMRNRAAERAYQERCHEAIVSELADAIEWAQILDRHEPSRLGSSEMHVFEAEAVKAVLELY